jgi:DNA-directed RNA polymerase subunit RPC12/RpoP
MIRVDCTKCGSYIMFAEKTPGNLKKAKKRELLTKKQLEKVKEIMKNRGKEVNSSDLKKIKKWTKEEADEFIKGDQTLF